MKVKALFTGLDLTKDKIYEVIHEYDTVYQLQCDTGKYCRDKGFFEIVEEGDMTNMGDKNETVLLEHGHSIEELIELFDDPQEQHDLYVNSGLVKPDFEIIKNALQKQLSK